MPPKRSNSFWLLRRSEAWHSGRVKAPIAAGDVLCQVEVRDGDKVVHSAPLVALADVEEAGIFGRLWDSIRLFFYSLFN